ncbi:chaplin family protein [Streptomyces canus]|uniref:chaplin n=1 Tax=Streptomyces canus TaxID=58343 RepID=UPI00371E3A2B
MRQVTRKGLMTVAAATGVIAAAGGAAHADSGASGSSANSPGVLSGNTVSVPVHVPVNVCGNTVDVVGVLNPAMGNSCANKGGGSGAHGGGRGSHGHGGHGGSGAGGSEGSHAGGHTGGSPGVGSGNHVEAPIHAPVNVCGNSVDLIGIGNPAMDNDCGNGSGGGRHTPPGGGHQTPPGSPEQPGNPGQPGNPAEPGNPGNPVEPGNPGNPATPPGGGHQTPGGGNHPGTQTVTQPLGSAQLARTGSDLPIGLALPVGAGALLAGTVLYRRARASA